MKAGSLALLEREEMRRSSAELMLRAELELWVGGLCHWEVFFTGTFEGEFSVPAAQRAFERFAKRNLPGVSWFYVLEANPSREGHHVHALLGDCHGLRRKSVWDGWFRRFGRNRVEPVRSQRDVADYCTKHVAAHYLFKGAGWFNVSISGQRGLRL